MDEELTYEAAAVICRVSSEVIRHRAKRGKLRRGRPTNTGKATVILTDDDIAAISAGRPAVYRAGGLSPDHLTAPVGPPPDQDVRTGGSPPSQDASTVSALQAVIEQSKVLQAAFEAATLALQDALASERAALARERAAVDRLQTELDVERLRREAIEKELTNRLHAVWLVEAERDALRTTLATPAYAPPVTVPPASRRGLLGRIFGR